MKTLHAKSKVEIIRRGLLLLKETTDRELLKEAYAKAARATAGALKNEVDDLDGLANEGLD